MKVPLQYQRTEFDCGPTALLNAVTFMFEREAIPPDILRYIMMYTLDSFNEAGEDCKSGTSQMAMMFLSNWLNQYARAKKLPINCEYLSGDSVKITENSRLIEALQQGGAVVVRLMYGVQHYVTLTRAVGHSVELWDPYYRKQPFAVPGISLIRNKPLSANRRVDFDVFAKPGSNYYNYYSLDTGELPEAVLLFNSETRRTQENTIEYFL
jgi:hypothetical protein